MSKWEYTHYQYDRDETNLVEVSADLNKLGDAGWEAFAVDVELIKERDFPHAYVTYHFKRPVPETPTKP